MAVFPCPTKSLCVDPSTPFANLTAEAPDEEIFIGFNTGYGPSYPPLGSEFTATGCTAFCESTVSQEDADLCAAQQNAECTSVIFPVSQVVADVNGNPAVLNHPRPLFRNSPQSATVFCPDGNPFVYTVPAGRFSAFSQAQANLDALSFAELQAPIFQVCLSGLNTPQVCAGAAYSDSITASGNFLAAPPAANVWQLVSGALPPGISILEFIFQTGLVVGNTIHLAGTCDVPGVYPFLLQVTDSKGDTMTKPFVIKVAGITNGFSLPSDNQDSPYTAQIESAGVLNPIYSLEEGSLPDGLILDPTGVISGTPTVGGTFDFVLGVTEAGTGLTCNTDAQIFIQAGLHFDNLAWIVPQFNLSANGTGTSVSSENTSHNTLQDNGFSDTSTVLSAGTMHYAGPQTAGNVQLTINTVGPFQGGGDAFVAINVIQDANIIGSIALNFPPNGAGVFNIPFTVLATVGSLLEIDFFCQVNNGNGFPNFAAVDATLVATPA